MCGIVGAVSAPQHRSGPGRGPAAARIPRLRLVRRRACTPDGELQRARSTARVADLAAQVDDDERRRRHRHRAHALGHARRAGRRTTRIRTSRPAPAPTRSRTLGPRRARAQRHHREPRRAARRAEGARATCSRARPTPRSSPTWSTSLYDGDLLDAVQRAVPRLHGAYAIAVFCRDEPHRVVGARAGLAADRRRRRRRRELPRLRRDGAGRRHRPDRLPRRRRRGRRAARQATGSSTRTATAASSAPGATPCTRTPARPSSARTATTCRRKSSSSRAPSPTRSKASPASCPSCSATRRVRRASRTIDSVLILACGTSYYAGLVAKYWIESHRRRSRPGRDRQRIPLPRQRAEPEHAGRHDLAERARPPTRWPRCKHARALGMTHTLTICNVATSAMVRECELAYITRAGVEIGVASTKAFTTQLVGAVPADADAGASARPPRATTQEAAHLKALRHLPVALQRGAGAGAADHRAGPRTSRARSTRCSSAAACTTRSRSKAR